MARRKYYGFDYHCAANTRWDFPKAITRFVGTLHIFCTKDALNEWVYDRPYREEVTRTFAIKNGNLTWRGVARCNFEMHPEVK